VPRPYPQEFRDDVVRVARNRDDGVTIEQIPLISASTR
jgi:transposase